MTPVSPHSVSDPRQGPSPPVAVLTLCTPLHSRHCWGGCVPAPTAAGDALPLQQSARVWGSPASHLWDRRQALGEAAHHPVPLVPARVGQSSLRLPPQWLAWSLIAVFSSDHPPKKHKDWPRPVPLPTFIVRSAPSFPSSLFWGEPSSAQPRGSRCFSGPRKEPAVFAPVTMPAIC